jgi:hypothetical protein
MKGTIMPITRNEEQKDLRVIKTVRRSAGTPQRMPKRVVREEVEPPSLAELQERQDEINSTRRPTKPYIAMQEEIDAESIAVPDVPPTKCG